VISEAALIKTTPLALHVLSALKNGYPGSIWDLRDNILLHAQSWNVAR